MEDKIKYTLIHVRLESVANEHDKSFTVSWINLGL